MASMHILSLVCVFYNETTKTKLFLSLLSLFMYMICIYEHYLILKIEIRSLGGSWC